MTLRFGASGFPFDRQPATRRFGAYRDGTCTHKVDAARRRARPRLRGFGLGGFRTHLAYTYRWKIEEFHKTWKTGGCNVEDTQLQSEHGLHVLSFVLATVAMRLQRLMWISRTAPGRPATEEFSDEEISAVFALKNAKRGGRSVVTVGRITLWIAELGGYTGKSSGGPPGAITLGRGLAQVLPVARAVRNIRNERLRKGDRRM